MCDPISKSSVKQGGKATAGWLTLGQGDPYGGSSELLGEELCGCVLAKLVPAAHGSLLAGAYLSVYQDLLVSPQNSASAFGLSG